MTYEATVRVKFDSVLERRMAEIAVEQFLNVAVSKQTEALKAQGIPLVSADVYSVRVVENRRMG